MSARWMSGRSLRRVVLAVALMASVAAPGAIAGTPSPAAAAPPQADQWHLAALNITDVHKLTTGTGVVMAVIDTGVGKHPDLDGQVVRGRSYLGDPDAWDIDDGPHGTGVAGLVAAKGGGPDHSLGVAPGARIMPIQVMQQVDSSIVGAENAGAAIRWAADNGAKVINLSMSVWIPIDSTLGTYTLKRLYDDVRYAIDKDVVIVACAGNNPAPTPNPLMGEGPAQIPGVLAVGATDRAGNLWSGSRQGAYVGLTAPGVDMRVITPEGLGTRPGYTVIPGGTSAAAPLVAGAAALIRSKYPQLRAPDVIQRLIATADDAGPAGRDEQYGFGRLNILRALTADVTPVTANPLGAPTAPPTRALPGDAPDRTPDPLRWLAYVGLGSAGVVVLTAGVVVLVVLLRRRRRPGVR
jgi:type VII secretion-associated serine protease mycosin